MNDPSAASNVVRANQEELWKATRAPGALGDKYRCRSFQVSKALPLRGLGLHVEELEPGACSCQLHHHLFEEEQFYLLEGTLTVRELHPDAEDYREYTLDAGDLVCYAPGTRIAHQFFNRSTVTARFLAFSTRHPGDVCEYPDSGKVLLRGVRQVGVFPSRGEARKPSELVALARSVAEARAVTRVDKPTYIASRVPWCASEANIPVVTRALSRAAGARQVFSSERRILPRQCSSELEYHVFAETILIAQSPGLTVRQVREGVEQLVALSPNDIMHWLPNDGIAHQIRNEGDVAATYLLVSDEPAHDVVCLPETGEVRVAALGRVGRVAALDYWEGA